MQTDSVNNKNAVQNLEVWHTKNDPHTICAE